MNGKFRIAALVPLAALAACTTVPTGPSVMVLPGTGKNFTQFRVDDSDCRQYAQLQVGGTANEAGVDSGLRSAAVGTAVGALAGAAMGGHEGAGTGAGVGLLMGSAAGAGAAQSSSWNLQQRYDNAYTQCMYAKGHRVPVPAGLTSGVQSQPAPASGGGNYPPPPPNYPPPNYPPPPPGR